MFRPRKANGSLTGAICIALGVVPASLPASADETPPVGTKVGQMYPDFLLPTLEGPDVRREGRLSDYRGKKVLLVHFASW